MKKKLTLWFLILSVAGYFIIHYFYDFNLFFQAKNTLNLMIDDKIESLDPAKAYSDDSLFVSSQVLEPLYQYHYLKRPYELQPLLAEEFPKISEDGKLIEIKIKKNIFYHPHKAFGGVPRELIAEDFVTQLKRISLESLQSPGRSLFLNLIEGFSEFSEKVKHDWRKIKTQNLSGVDARDKYTLRIRLLKNDPNLIYYLSLNFMAPVPWEVVNYFANILDHTLIGTGPYLFQGLKNNKIFMSKNKAYREDFYPTSGDRYANVGKLLDSSREKIPFIENLQFEISGDERARWEKFLKKEVDILSVPRTYISKLFDETGAFVPELSRKKIVLKHFPAMANRWLAFNMRDPVLGKNLYLRKAIAHALNYADYLKQLTLNTSLRANSLLVPGIAGYSPSKAFPFHYDLELSKVYLKKALQNLSGKMPKIIYSTRGNQGISLQEADVIKKQLELIGLKVELEVLNFPEFLRKGRAGELMFFTDNWLFDYPIAENILQLLVSTNAPGINKSGYFNPKIDKLYLKLKETNNLDERDLIIREMEETVFEDVPWIPLMYESSFILHYPEIKNFRESSIIRNYIKYLKIEK
jgi:oligopeptide transport system substrate-binding protein